MLRRTLAKSAVSSLLKTRCSPSSPALVASRCFATASKLNDLKASELSIRRAATLKTKPSWDSLVFGHTFTDHMLSVDWDDQNGFYPPQIHPYQPLLVDPAASVFHYSLECFEGLKAYKDRNDRIRLFRPDMNLARFNNSLARLYMPQINSHEFLECMKHLLKVDRDWIPSEHGNSLYIRPTAIATTPWLGVGPAKHVKFYVIICPVGPYYASGFAPVKLWAESNYARAWQGGVGDAKVGSNYSLSILPAMLAKKRGYDQVLWLSGPEHYVTEVGTMNQFFFWVNPEGKKELVTAPLDGTILPGVTRDSILTLAKEWNEFEVSEKRITMPEVVKAIKEKRMIEAFGSGTAAVISPIECIHYQGQDYNVPLDGQNPQSKIGALSNRLLETLTKIHYGVTDHKWSVVVEE